MSTPVRLTIAALFFSASTAIAQDAADTLDPVRQLYASAEYEEALSALGRLQPETPASGLEIDRYRAMCLIALNRGSEADRVIESIVAADPLYQPPASDASPRVRSAFSTVRERVLPALARSLYLEAKAAYDRKDYTDAARTLERTVRVIDTIESPVKNELADLRMLASGFLDLSKAAAAPPAPAAPVTPVTPAAPETAASAPTPVAPPPTPAAPPNTGLVVLRQELPPMPFSIASLGSGEYRGVVELQIDEGGNVTSARIIQPVHAIYDPILLKAVRDWKYEAPRVAGRPIATVKRVQIVLKP
jgi:TonB family protein